MSSTNKLTDLTEQQEPEVGPTPKRPRYRHADYSAMVAAAEGRKPHYYPEYEFRGGKRFLVRDKLLNPKTDSG